MDLITLIKEKKYKNIATFLRHNPEERGFLLQKTEHIPNNSELKNNELVYIIVNNIKDLPKCVCGNPLDFIKPSVGYKVTCGDKQCVNQVSTTKRKQTNNKLYGGNSPMSSDKIKKRLNKQ